MTEILVAARNGDHFANDSLATNTQIKALAQVSGSCHTVCGRESENVPGSIGKT